MIHREKERYGEGRERWRQRRVRWVEREKRMIDKEKTHEVGGGKGNLTLNESDLNMTKYVTAWLHFCWFPRQYMLKTFLQNDPIAFHS